MFDWKNVGNFERHPKVNDVLVDLNQGLIVKFLDDGKVISAEVLGLSMKSKGIKGMKAKDTLVFVVENKNQKNELWISATSFTNLGELKRIRDANGETLIGAKVKITRVSKDDPEKASLKFEKA